MLSPISRPRGESLTTLQDLFRKGRSLLEEKVAAPSVEAKVLLLEAARIGEVEWLASSWRRVSRREELRYERLLARRLSGVPLAYITGRKEFWSMILRVERGVFIPRPETELIVERVLAAAKARGKDATPTIVDVGTGSGNIALALAKELPGARVIAADVSARALLVAESNARALGIRNVRFLNGSMFETLRGRRLEGKCGFIVSNPPYVSAAEWEALPAEVREHEPRRGLVGGKTGLEFIGRLVAGTPEFLKPGGYLIFEVGFGQAENAMALFKQEQIVRSYAEVRSFSDLRGIPRVIQARRQN